MSVTKERAREIKNLLLTKLDGLAWVRGIGLAHGTAEPTIRVNVSSLTAKITEHIKSLTQDVPVIIDEVGEIIPR